MDLSKRAISTKLQGEIIKFFRNTQLTQDITELNVSNLRVRNWQMDDQLEEFISICPHLEALHVLNCGMSLQRLCRILKQAPTLKALSWSLSDFTPEFLVNRIKSSEVICLQNITYLHFEMSGSKSDIQIVKYLLSCCRDLEELEIYTFLTDQDIRTQLCFPLAADQVIPGFPLIPVGNELQHLHSLVVVVGDQEFEYCDHLHRDMLSDLVFSVVTRKSSSTKWKKLWISPSILIKRMYPIDLLLFLHQVHPHDFQSVEEIALEASSSAYTVDRLKTFFETIGDDTVRSMHLRLPSPRNSIVELCNSISRAGGDSLKFLRLSASSSYKIPAEQNVVLHTLFSNCSQITELDLLDCCFEEGICEPLSELKHLTKVQLMECAINSEHCRFTQVEKAKPNLVIFVENCKNITHFDIRGCYNEHSLCPLTDGLLALAKFRKLESLTLYKISGITEWTFLKNISEHCKYLTALRLSPGECLNFPIPCIPILIESVKFLKHLAIELQLHFLGSNDFWNLLSHAKNLQRLCITSRYSERLRMCFIPDAAVETLKSLPRLHVLHVHSRNIENVTYFHDQVIRMLEEKESDCRFSFEILLEYGRYTLINHQIGYRLISNKSLPLNRVELCDMTPILSVPRL